MCAALQRGQSPGGGLIRIVLHSEEYLVMLLSKSSYRILSQGCDIAPNAYRKSTDRIGGEDWKTMNFRKKNRPDL